MERKQVMIGDRAVGGGARAFLVFEGGATHTGLASALRLVDIAADAGVDAIKFQTVFADKMMAAADVPFDYGTIDGGTQRESLAAILRRREMPFPDWARLKARADERRLCFFSTPDTPETIDFLVRIGTPAIKIAGGDMNNYPLIQYAAATKLPVLLDTRGTLGELERAIETCVVAGNEQLVIVHCPSGYPSAVESIRLRMIEVYRRLFPFPVGFSDHSPGLEMNVAALALGADFIEKTITLDRAAPGPEHVMSLPPEATREFVVRLREVEQALGSPYATIVDAGAKQAMLKARRSIVLSRSARAGETLTQDMLTYKRPGYGIAPELAPLVVGRVLRRDVAENVPLPWEAI
jgi:N,N'-diacetyllegionaminate synthase